MLRLAISTRVTLQRMQPISLLILVSVFSDCVIFYGDIILILSTAIMLQIILRFLYLPGTSAYSGLQNFGNRHDV